MPDRLVLGYHAVSDASVSRQTVKTDALRRQVSDLVGRGYVGVTFNRVVLEPSAQRRLAVTFDDGERCVLEHALPVLAELGVPGTVFVVVATIGAPGLLDWEDLEVLAAAGWEVGSHTVTHARLAELDDASVDEELLSSRHAIEDRLGRPCRSIAYPYGESNERIRAAAARAGYTAGCTTDGTLRTEALGWSRVGVDGRDRHLLFRLKTSRLGRALRATSLRTPLDRSGRLLRRAGVLRQT